MMVAWSFVSFIVNNLSTPFQPLDLNFIDILRYEIYKL